MIHQILEKNRRLLCSKVGEQKVREIVMSQIEYRKLSSKWFDEILFSIILQLSTENLLEGDQSNPGKIGDYFVQSWKPKSSWNCNESNWIQEIIIKVIWRDFFFQLSTENLLDGDPSNPGKIGDHFVQSWRAKSSWNCNESNWIQEIIIKVIWQDFFFNYLQKNLLEGDPWNLVQNSWDL